MKTSKLTVTEASGNVFADLGFSPAEARNLQLRSQMMTALRKYIADRGLTQAEAARILHVSQPRVSDLVQGKVSQFSMDILVNMLAETGSQIDFRIKMPPRRVA